MTSGTLARVQSLLTRLNSKGVGYAALGSAASSTSAYILDPGHLHDLLTAAGFHLTPAQFVIGVLLGSVVAAYFGMPATIKTKIADTIGKELPKEMSATGKLIGPILEDGLKIAEADKAALFAKLAESNVSIVDLVATSVETLINDAQIPGPLGGVLGTLLKSSLTAAVTANKAKLVTLAGTEEQLAFTFLDAQAKKFIAGLEA